MTLTVIIRDEGPVRHLNEPCTYRSVQIALTEDQAQQLVLHDNEAIGQCFLEASDPPSPAVSPLRRQQQDEA